MIRNALFWVNHLRYATLPFLDTYIDCVETKLLPVFANIEEEVDKFREGERVRLGHHVGPDDDVGDFFESVQENALGYYQTLRAIEQGLLNLYAVALYHQWEQQLLFLYRIELLPPRLENDRTQLDSGKALQAFAERGIVMTAFPTWPSIDELRLVANVVKHAEGGSAEELRKKRPDFFRRQGPILFKKRIRPDWVPKHLYEPLSGDDFYMTSEAFRAYAEAIRDFWEELIRRLWDMGTAALEEGHHPTAR